MGIRDDDMEALSLTLSLQRTDTFHKPAGSGETDDSQAAGAATQ